jgi:Co/Zn/Cd efflux system component
MEEKRREDRSVTKKLLEDSSNSEEKSTVSNLCILYVTAALFGGFVIAEIIGALAGHSLSLLGDATAMIVDVFTYFSNMYAEHVKAKYGILDEKTRYILEVYVPTFSICALLGVTGYIVSDAVSVIKDNGNGGDDVNIVFLWAFSSANAVVDVISGLMFYIKGADALRVHAPVRTFSRAERVLSGEGRKVSFLPNLNMMSALTHVGSDTLRTASVFIAALITTVSGANGNLCDAWAAIVVSITIIFAVIPLCNEIYKASGERIEATADNDIA